MRTLMAGGRARMAWRRTPAGLALAAALAAALGSCGWEQPPPPRAGAARPPVPVLTAKAGIADVPVVLRAIGTVEPVQSSPVRAQVGGTLMEVRFREGDRVRAGDVLFVIDPRPIETTVRQLEANPARDEAQLARFLVSVSNFGIASAIEVSASRYSTTRG